MTESDVDEDELLQRYEDAFVQLLIVSNNPGLKDEVFDATVRFHVVWTELEAITPKIGRFDPRFLKLIDRVEARVRESSQEAIQTGRGDVQHLGE
jgi:hypothetical protein